MSKKHAGEGPHGFFLLDKPAGLTSHDAVARVRYHLNTRKVGHAGTLDPAATGLLLLGVGYGTKLLTYAVGLDKTYEATIRLGHATVTDDAEGEQVGQTAPENELRAILDEYASLENAIADLTGDIAQVPSAVSAIKVNGVRSYARVRGGESVELAARPIRVDRFEIREARMSGGFLDVDCVVDCSSGTYIRALARDLGAALGVGGHLTALRRTRVGGFTVEAAQLIPERDAPRAAEDPSAALTLTPLGKAALSFLPLHAVSESEATALRHGQWIEASQASDPEAFPAAAIVPPTGELVAIVEPAPKRGLLKSASVIPRFSSAPVPRS